MLSPNSKQILDEQGYFVCRDLFSPKLMELLFKHFEFLRDNYEIRKKRWGEGETHEHGAFIVHEAFLDVFSLYLTEKLGAHYLPAFSYCRAYGNKSSLHRHVDREGCELACSIPLAIEKNNPWPLHVSLDKDADGTPVHLNIGDALIYKGNKVFHWRESFEGKEHVQLFLFCVLENGPNDEKKYDGRKSLGLDMKKLLLIETEEERWQHRYQDMVQKFEAILEGSLDRISN